MWKNFRKSRYAMAVALMLLLVVFSCDIPTEIDNAYVEIYMSNDTLKTDVNKVVVYKDRIDFYKVYFDEKHDIQKTCLRIKKKDIDSLVIQPLNN